MAKELNSQTVKFREACKGYLDISGHTKKMLAELLDIDPGYFSKLYVGFYPATDQTIERAQQISAGKIEPQMRMQAPQARDTALILGRLDQLTRQIADLQASHGETRGMVNAKLEGVSDTIAGIERRVRATELRQAAQNKKREVGEKSGRKHL